jgi:hypothetical protein
VRFGASLHRRCTCNRPLERCRAQGEPAFETEKRERAAVPSMVDKPNSGSTSRALMNLLVDLVGPLTVTAGPVESHCSNQARRYLYGWTYPNNAEQHDEARAGLQFILLGIYIYSALGALKRRSKCEAGCSTPIAKKWQCILLGLYICRYSIL